MQYNNKAIKAFPVCLVFFTISVLLISCGNSGKKTTAEFKSGVAKLDITPPVGYPVHKTPSDGILDPLEVKTIVLSQGDCTMALISADLFYIPVQLSETVRKLSSAKTGIPVSNICLTATHTHADPTCYEEVIEYTEHVKSGRQADADQYSAQLISKLVQSVADAQANMKPAEIKSGIQKMPGISFNRRHLMKDGTVKMNGGFLNSDIIRAVGPADPDLGMVVFTDAANDKPFASLSTFAMQLATIGNTKKFSSGFPHFMEQELRKKFGDDFISIFGEGPCADVNHWDITKPGPQAGYESATRTTGEKMAAGFLEKYPGLTTQTPSLEVAGKIIEVPLQTYSKMDLEWAESYADSAASAIVKARIRKILTLKELRKEQGETLPLEIQVFRLNDETALVALPGQIFTELGLALKEASPFKNTLIITLANSHEDCIPLRKAYPEGSYEIIYSLVESGGGEMLIDTAISLLNEIKNR
ncbi:MAG: neutral/alkaline non-lysosomal ceramidase N-terminal domain-containing protein [Prolixibacteraceae bacterium]|nr:neutral/alkaline non-lysosomal ceramidase N-terminal domain-containing protein [Prolixibacteraceae bacterium]